MMPLVIAGSWSTMLDHDFMRHAFVATALLAPACGIVGYFVVLRNEVFAGDALSHVAFTGSLAALAFGANQRVGLFAGTMLFAALLGSLGRKAKVSDVTIGVAFTWILGLGVLCLSVFTSAHSSSNSQAGPNVLFGSVFGISSAAAIQALIVGGVVCVVMTLIARPLLFASLDASVAAARGVPTRALGAVLMVILGLVVAEATQAVGALLLLGLIATPAATAHRLTDKPYLAMWLSAGLCLAEVWLGLTLSYLFPQLPAGFVLIGLAFAVFVLVSIKDMR